MSIHRLSPAECPNAACAICHLQTRNGGGKVVKATAEIRKPNLRYFVCAGHEARAESLAHLLKFGKKK